MSEMFSDCSSLTSLNVSSFVTSKVIDMSEMFSDCSSLTSLNVSSFVTSKVTNMRSLFNGCSALTSLDLSNFDTSNVTDMSNMFYVCTKLTELDLSNFDTSKVTTMRNMFSYCSSLSTILFRTSSSVSKFKTSNVTDMSRMFDGCSNIMSLNVSSFDTSKVTDMSCMFQNCTKLWTLNASEKFITTNVINSENMFKGCTSIEGQTGFTYNSASVSASRACIVQDNGVEGYFTYSRYLTDTGTHSFYLGLFGGFTEMGVKRIDTQVPLNSNINLKFKINMSTTVGTTILGQATESESKSFRIFNFDNKFYYDYGSGGGYNRVTSSAIWNNYSTYTFRTKNRNVYAFNNTTGTDLGQIISASDVTFNYTDLTLQVSPVLGSDAYNWNSYLYYLQVYDGSTLIHNFIPAVYHLPSSQTTGLYDLLTGKFYEAVSNTSS